MKLGLIRWVLRGTVARSVWYGVEGCGVCDCVCFCVFCYCFFFLIMRRPPRSTQSRSSAASDVYKRQPEHVGEPTVTDIGVLDMICDIAPQSSSLHLLPEPLQMLNALHARMRRVVRVTYSCLLYTSPSPRDRTRTRMPSSA